MRKLPFSLMQLVLALAGFFVAGLLYFAHKHAFDLPCSASGGGCELVNSSRWSHIGPIPIAAFGMLGYAMAALLAMVKMTAETQRAATKLNLMLLVLSALGTAYSWYLQYVAAVDIEAFCIYCRTSAILMTAIFLVSLAEQYRVKWNKNNAASEEAA